MKLILTIFMLRWSMIKVFSDKTYWSSSQLKTQVIALKGTMNARRFYSNYDEFWRFITHPNEPNCKVKRISNSYFKFKIWVVNSFYELEIIWVGKRRIWRRLFQWYSSFYDGVHGSFPPFKRQIPKRFFLGLCHSWGLRVK